MTKLMDCKGKYKVLKKS